MFTGLSRLFWLVKPGDRKGLPVAFICCLHLPPAAAAGSGGPDRVAARAGIPVPRQDATFPLLNELRFSTTFCHLLILMRHPLYLAAAYYPLYWSPIAYDASGI